MMHDAQIMKPIARRTLLESSSADRPKSPLVAHDPSCNNLFVQHALPRDEKEQLAIMEISSILQMRTYESTPMRPVPHIYHTDDVSPPDRFFSPPLRAANPAPVSRNFERDFASLSPSPSSFGSAERLSASSSFSSSGSSWKLNSRRLEPDLAAAQEEEEADDTSRRGLQIPTHHRMKHRSNEFGFQLSPPIQCS